MIHVVVFSSILAITCGYALWRGGAPERWVAVLFAGSFIATLAVPFHTGRSFHTVERGFLSVDAVLLALLTIVALKANRFWPMWLTATQLLGVAIHGVKAYDPTLAAWLYNSATGKIAYPMVMILAIGVARHRERIVRHGTDPDWTAAPREALTS